MNSSRYSLDDSSPSSYHMKPSEDQQHHLSSEKTQPYLSTSLSSHVLTYSIDQDHGSCFPRANNFASEGGSSHDHGFKLCLWKNENGQENRSDLHHDHCQDGSTKWLPSKLRFVRRMMMNSNPTAKEAPAQPQMKFEEYQKQASPISPMEATENSSNSSSSNNNNNPIRVCADCNTTKTPLWRSGPRGPKSLCNACGIRQRKARRAMAAAVAAAANGTILVAESTTPLKLKVQQKDKKLKINAPLAPCKNRSKLGNGRKKQLCFEDFLINLNKNLAFHQVFPQEEKEAAILLMALSCGLVHG